jgi:DNA-directed RNA polymerase subunit RPC12/RpoP
MPIGPKIGDKIEVELKVEAEGWPLPNFQWYRNGKLMPGETSNVLKVEVYCPLSDSTRSYRCTRCKNMCRTAPKNGYEIICANCGYKFDYKEVSVNK